MCGGQKMSGSCGGIDNKSVGKRMREMRESNGLTQEEMAEILGVNPNAVRAYERGEYGISKEVMTRIRNHFHVSIDFLLYGAGNDWDYLLLQIENASEENKMKALMRLVFYFVRDKRKSYSRETQDAILDDGMKNLLGDIGNGLV